MKDFFLKKDHLKIFYLYQKKIYLDLCLAQTEMVNKGLKTFVLKKMAKHKAKLSSYNVDNNQLLDLVNLKAEMHFFYRLAKNYILLNYNSFRFRYFLDFFLSNLLRSDATVRLKLAQELNYYHNSRFWKKLSFSKDVLSKRFSFSFYANWFRKFILYTNKIILIPTTTKAVFTDKNLRSIDLKISEGNDIFKKEP